MKYKILLKDSEGKEKIKEVILEEGTLRIGREKDNDLVLSSTDVSRHHAEIVLKGDSIAIIDLQSKNGTYVNGKKIDKSKLKVGDSIQIGSYVLEVDVMRDEAETVPVTVKESEEEKFPKLIGLTPPFEGDEIKVNKFPYKIGKKPINDLVINDEHVSREHAVLLKEDGNVILQDLNSTNGTFVNGQKIERRKLDSGDVIAFDIYQFRFELPGDRKTQIRTDKTTKVRFKEPMEEPVGKVEAKEPALELEEGPPGPGYLVVVAGSDKGKTFPLKGRLLYVGRGLQNDIVLSDNSVSDTHCAIRWIDGKFVIEDLNSKNGTFVNDKPVKVADLNSGDKIRIGRVNLLFTTRLEGVSVEKKERETEPITLEPRRAPVWPWILGFIGLAIAAWIVLKGPSRHISASSLNLLWHTKIRSISRATPTLSDITKDGIPDIILTAEDSLGGKIEAYSGSSHKLIWEYRPTLKTSGFASSPLAIDLSGDKVPEIIAPSVDGLVYAVDGLLGRKFWISEKKIVNGATTSPLASDFDHEGSIDIAIAGADGHIYFFDGDRGLLLKRSVYTSLPIVATPALVRINDDDIMDVVVTTGDGGIYTIDGKRKWQIWKYLSKEAISTSPIIANADADKEDEIVVITDGGNLLVFDLSDPNPRASYQLKIEVWDTPVAADITRDGIDEIIIPCRDGTVRVFDLYSRNFLWKTKVASPDDKILSPVLADISGDGIPDVFCVSHSDGAVRVIDGDRGRILTAEKLGVSVSVPPSLGDVDGDGTLDIVVVSDLGDLFALTTGYPLKKRGQVVWPTYKHDFYRSGSM